MKYCHYTLARNSLGLVSIAFLYVASPCLAEIVDVDPPGGGDDYVLLQTAIDNNPGAILHLGEGTYDIGPNALVIPHELVVQGKVDQDGDLLTLIDGVGPVAIHVNLTGEASRDSVAMSDLMVNCDNIAVLHSPGAPAPYSSSYQPGGGNLTIDGCHLLSRYWFAVWALHINKVSLKILNSSLTSLNDDVVRVQYADYKALEVRNCVFDISEVQSFNWSQDCIEILNDYDSGIWGDWQEWQTPGTEKTYICNNEFITATGLWQGGIRTIKQIGTMFIHGNELNQNASGMAITLENTTQASAIRIEQNTFNGGPFIYELYRSVLECLELVEEKSDGGGHVQFLRNTVTGDWSVGVEMYLGCYKNTFVNNDFSGAVMLGSSFWGPWIPVNPVHYEFWDTGKNSVTDSSGADIYYTDYGDKNHFQGKSTFISVP